MPLAAFFAAAPAAFLIWCSAALATGGPFPVPQGPVLLTVSGAISAQNAPDGVALDRDMLEALGSRTIETSTIWTDGVQQFRGVPLSRLMDALGAQGDRILAHAVTDYCVWIPADDWDEDGPIVAYERNGEDMTLRDKGPLWVIYPFDDDPRYRSETVYFRSIWQLNRIIVMD